MPKLMVIDGNSLMHRAFHALPLLNNAQGEYTNAVYGFLGMLLRLLKEEAPDYAAVAFDMHSKTFRHHQYSEYKAGRKQTPDELIPQFDMLKQALDAMGIATIEREGLEADDLLGILSNQAGKQGIQSLLVTGDKDALQLVDEDTTVIFTRRGISDTDRMDSAAVVERLGVDPAHVPDLKGLMGDNSDNIPGVPCVGEKTARKLLGEYGDLESVLAHAQEVSGPKLRGNLTEYADQARMSKQLATIDPTLDVGIAIEDYIYNGSDMQKVRPVFKRYGFETLLKRMGVDSDAAEKGTPSQPAETKRLPAQPQNGIKAQSCNDINDLKALLNRTGNSNSEFSPAIYIDDSIHIGFEEKDCVFDFTFEVSKTLLNEGLDFEEAMALIRAHLQDESRKALLFDAKSFARQYDIDIKARVDDVILAAYTANPAQGQDGLDKLCEKHGLPSPTETPAADMLLLFNILNGELRGNDMEKLYTDMELPLWGVLYRMEREGFQVDMDALRQMGESYALRIKQLEADIHQMAGESFNINSSQQLSDILFSRLGLTPGKKTKSGYSTNIDVLESLKGEHPIIELIIEYRHAAKLKSTYMDGLLAVADKQTGRIHTCFRQNITATGRISSTEPNLQNIPVRTEQGREIRRAFIPSEQGRALVVADYSQIELRILAHMSDDENMIANFSRGGDIHASTAAEVFGVARQDVTPELRSAAKAVNFGIVYGIGDFSLGKQLGISKAQAGEYIHNYFDRYPKVQQFMQASVAAASTEGYVSTLYGRRRYVEEIKSRNYNIRSFGERIAMNAPIQGTAADIIKLAMINVDAALSKAYPQAHMILQVHDELIVDCPEDIKEDIMTLLKNRMESVIQLKAPLIADVGSGKTWLDAK